MKGFKLNHYLPRHQKFGFHCVLWLFLWSGYVTTQPASTQIKVVSQCYKEGSLSYVSLYCGYQKVINIRRIFHGVHRLPDELDCTYFPEDCTTDQSLSYDLNKCDGTHDCVINLQAISIPHCGHRAAGARYLQVEYVCNPGEEVTSTTTTKMPSQEVESIENLKPTENAQIADLAENQIWDICENQTARSSILQLQTPGYPYSYPTHTDCRCEVRGGPDTQLSVTFLDLVLMTHSRKCVDWLMLEAPHTEQGRAVMCGNIEQKKRSIVTKQSNLTVHFHSAKAFNNTSNKKRHYHRRLRGFDIQIKSKPDGAPFDIVCFKTTSRVLAELESQYSSQRFNGNPLVLRPVDPEVLTKTLIDKRNKEHAPNDQPKGGKKIDGSKGPSESGAGQNGQGEGQQTGDPSVDPAESKFLISDDDDVTSAARGGRVISYLSLISMALMLCFYFIRPCIWT